LTAERHDGSGLRLAIRLSSNLSAETLVEGARLAEEVGLDRCWFADNPYERPALITVAAVSQATRRIGLGVGTVSVRLRHPMVLAQDAMAAAALCNGRFALGLGTGVESHRSALGLARLSGLKLMAETIATLRVLFDGGAATFEGGDADGVKVAFSTAAPPIFVGAVGPRSLGQTGRMADGVIFSNGVSLAYLKKARELLRAAIAESPQPARRFEQVAYVIYGGDVDRAEVNRRLKRIVAYFVDHMAVMFEGTELGDEAAAAVDALHRGLPVESVVTDEMLDSTCVWGDADSCVEQLQRYQDMGIGEVALSIGDWLPDPVQAVGSIGEIVRAWHRQPGRVL
jgi:5,10-methylenetetrahydromethanopterin reductase